MLLTFMSWDRVLGFAYWLKFIDLNLTLRVFLLVKFDFHAKI